MAKLKSLFVDIVLNSEEFGVLVDSYHIVDNEVDDIIGLIESKLNSMSVDTGIQTYLSRKKSFNCNNYKVSKSLTFTVRAFDESVIAIDAVSKEAGVEQIVQRIKNLDFVKPSNIEFKHYPSIINA